MLQIDKFTKKEQHWFTTAHDPDSSFRILAGWGFHNIMNRTGNKIGKCRTECSHSDNLDLFSPWGFRTAINLFHVPVIDLYSVKRIALAFYTTKLTPQKVVLPLSVFPGHKVFLIPLVTTMCQTNFFHIISN